MFSGTVGTVVLLAVPLLLGAGGLGVLVGFWAAVLRRRTVQWASRLRNLFNDACIGAGGFAIGTVLSLTLPWSGSYETSDGWGLTNIYPYFWQTTYGLAALLPFAFELLRPWRGAVSLSARAPHRNQH